MRCDVCGCRVSRRDSICPNCGYQLRKDEPTTIASPKRNKTIKVKKYGEKGISGKIILFLTALLILGILVFSPENIEDMRFEDIVEDHRDDEYGTVSTAIDNRNRMIDHIYDSGFVYFNINENAYVHNDELTAISYIYIGKPEDSAYSSKIIIFNKNGECIQCCLEDDCEKEQFPPHDINDYSRLLGYGLGLSKKIEDVKGPFVQRYEYKDDVISLYVLESANGPDVHYRIAFNGTKINTNSMY